MIDRKDFYIEVRPKTVSHLAKKAKDGDLVILPQPSTHFKYEPVEALLLGTFRNEFIFRTDPDRECRLILRSGQSSFLRDVITFVNGNRIANECIAHDFTGKTIEEIDPLTWNRIMDTPIICRIISPSTPADLVPLIVEQYGLT